LGVIIGVLFILCSMPAVTAYAAQYEANWESLDKRPMPEWFQDAKFGIFIHWGVYSVPAWGPKDAYAEWYWNRMGVGVDGRPADKNKTSKTWDFHKKVYGEDFKYQDFAHQFKAELFDPDHWADVFKNAGAKYVVLTSKHHEGFCLWPSKQANQSWGRPWNSVDIGPKRDLLGDLTESVRNVDLKMGIYYSLYEWYNPLWNTNREVFVTEHMIPQFKDIVTNYQPSIIFSDGEWDMPSSDWKTEELMAWLFNESPCKDDVVINDRWGKECRHKHGGYFTTEYTAGLETDSPWEESRGMGHSYGFNRNENLENYKTPRELLLMLVDLVSRGGNLLLDIGPDADGTIPVIMEQRLIAMGQWLQANGEAIYGTQTWTKNRQWSNGDVPKANYDKQYMVKYDVNEVTGAKTGEKAVVDAFFTQKDNNIYAITPRWPGEKMVFKNMKASTNSKVTLLGMNIPLQWKTQGENIVVEFPRLNLDKACPLKVYAIKLTNVE